MIEEKRKLIMRDKLAGLINPYNYADRNHYNESPGGVLKEPNESFGFNIKEHPDKVASVLEEAINSHELLDIE